jgi:hypothetical protein
LARFGETLPREEILQMPAPGSLPHLDFLANFDIPPDSHLYNPINYLKETKAATSLARVVRRHRTKGSLDNLKINNMLLIPFDSSRDGTGHNWPRAFSGSVSIYPQQITPAFGEKFEPELVEPAWQSGLLKPDELRLLTGELDWDLLEKLILGGTISKDPVDWPEWLPKRIFSMNQLTFNALPDPDEIDDGLNYKYTLSIPLTNTLDYDDDRHNSIQAGYIYTQYYPKHPDPKKIYSPETDGKYYEFAMYREVTDSKDPRYDESNSLVFHSVMKDLNQNLSDYFRHVYGEPNPIPALEPSTPDLVRWRDDYYLDDPDQLLKTG